MPIAGIDVSHFNGEVDWIAAGDSVTFAFAKATRGTSFLDPRFQDNWPRMRDAGVKRGAYHFFDSAEDAASQADHFLNSAKLEPGDLPPALNLEMLRRSSLSYALQGATEWLAVVQSATGRVPIVHTSASFWQQLGDPLNPGEYPLWLSHFGVAHPMIPRAWRSWTFWQFSQLGRCAGVKGFVNLNRFTGSCDDLNALGQ